MENFREQQGGVESLLSAWGKGKVLESFGLWFPYQQTSCWPRLPKSCCEVQQEWPTWSDGVHQALC